MIRVDFAESFHRQDEKTILSHQVRSGVKHDIPKNTQRDDGLEKNISVLVLLENAYTVDLTLLSYL